MLIGGCNIQPHYIKSKRLVYALVIFLLPSVLFIVSLSVPVTDIF
jgi:hypothetical protein